MDDKQEKILELKDEIAQLTEKLATLTAQRESYRLALQSTDEERVEAEREEIADRLAEQKEKLSAFMHECEQCKR